MSGIERYDPSVAAPARPGPRRPHAAPGPSSDVSSASFTADVLDFADLPTTFAPATGSPSTAVELFAGPSVAAASAAKPGELVLHRPSSAVAVVAPGSVRIDPTQVYADAARQLAKPRRVGEQVVQRRIGWQATPHAVVVSVVDRPLARRDDGKYAPAGPWAISTRHTYPNATGPARRTTGSLPAAPPKTAPVTSNGPAPSGPSAPTPMGDAAQVMSYLPDKVRAGVLAAVPTASVFDGELVQYSRHGQPVRTVLSLLRMGADRAIVINATLPTGGTAWEIVQADYRLGEPTVERAGA